MGNKLSAPQTDVPDKIVTDPLRLDDPKRVGALYIIGCVPSSESSRTHYSVIVDVSGESNSEQIVGKELTIDDYSRDDQKIFLDLRPSKQRFPRAQLVKCDLVGFVPVPPNLLTNDRFTVAVMLWCTTLDMATENFYFQFNEGLWAAVKEPSYKFATELAHFLLNRDNDLYVSPALKHSQEGIKV